MEAQIYIPELNKEVRFEGTVKFNKGFSGSLIEPPEPEGWFCEDAEWDDKPYTPEENYIIWGYVLTAENRIEELYRKENNI